jgi:hypothetical protein
MTTPRMRSLVSLAAALTITLTLGGCASAASSLGREAPTPMEGRPLPVRFDNDARDYVHVYLVGEQRQWLLARVAPGARAMLRIPDEALAGDVDRMRLAVLAGERVTLWAPSEARATMTLAQPMASFLSQRWTFTQALTSGQLTPLPLARARTDGVRQ